MYTTCVRSEKSIVSHRTRISGNYKLPHTGPENWNSDLCKGNKCLNHKKFFSSLHSLLFSPSVLHYAWGLSERVHLCPTWKDLNDVPIWFGMQQAFRKIWTPVIWIRGRHRKKVDCNLDQSIGTMLHHGHIDTFHIFPSSVTRGRLPLPIKQAICSWDKR